MKCQNIMFMLISSDDVIKCLVLSDFQKSKEKKQQIVTMNKLNEGMLVEDLSVKVVCSWFEV